MPPESIVRSRQNPIYKQLRSLLRRDRRHQERAFIVEGPRFIADAIAAGATPTLVALAESVASSADWLDAPTVAPRILDDDLFASVSDTVTSQGALAVFPFPELEPPAGQPPFMLVADGIQDPGNLGTLIRSAAGAGVTQVVALPATVDPWSPKVVRAAASAHFIVPVSIMTFAELEMSLPSNGLVVAADAAGSQPYDEVTLAGPLAIIIGSEGRGLSAGTLALDPLLISIPLNAGLESLNAGVAGSIVLFEASRQRRLQAISGETSDSI